MIDNMHAAATYLPKDHQHVLRHATHDLGTEGYPFAELELLASLEIIPWTPRHAALLRRGAVRGAHCSRQSGICAAGLRPTRRCTASLATDGLGYSLIEFMHGLGGRVAKKRAAVRPHRLEPACMAAQVDDR